MKLDDFHGGPLQLVERAVAAKELGAREERRGRGRAYDEIWCIHDVDEHPSLYEAAERAAANDIHLAITNPCIELWFVLHFRDQTAYIDRRDAQSAAKELLGCEKSLTDRALELLDAGYEDAAGRAQRLDAKHEGDARPKGSNPSSGVWRLIEAIRSG